MRSLFLRLFISFWAAMTLIGVAFAVIYVLSYSSDRIERRKRFGEEILLSFGRDLASCHAAGEPDCTARSTMFEEELDFAVYLYRGDELLFGPSAPLPEAHGLARRAAASQQKETIEGDDDDLVAMPLSIFGDASDDMAASAPYVAVGELRRSSPSLRYLGLGTLPQRILVVFLVSGLVSYLLARYLTRPIRTLREASQRIADGDLSVRVTPELETKDRELAALGADFDRMAERIDGLLEAQRRLLRDVSHELRSPLARLSVALELVRQKAGPDATAALDRIERESGRLNELISKVLTISRLESTEKTASESELDLSALVEQLTRDAHFEGQGQAQTQATVQPDIWIRADEELMRSAVENVLRNALRFSPASGEVTLDLRKTSSGVELTIADEGPGVPDSSIADIFRPFYRVGTDRDRKTGGAGVGLAIAQRALKLHGGEIQASNRTEGGLSVTLRLPAERLVEPPVEGALA